MMVEKIRNTNFNFKQVGHVNWHGWQLKESNKANVPLPLEQVCRVEWH